MTPAIAIPEKALLELEKANTDAHAIRNVKDTIAFLLNPNPPYYGYGTNTFPAYKGQPCYQAEPCTFNSTRGKLQ